VGVTSPEPVEKLTIKSSDLSDTTQVFVLSPDSDAAKH
jgi:hypothetical protein